MQKYVWTGVFILAIIGMLLWTRGGKKEGTTISPEGQAPASEVKQVETTETTPEKKDTSINNTNKKTLDGMTIEIIKEGNGPEIKNGQTAVVQYEGKLTSGAIFDSTAKHGGQPFEFSLGAGMVIKGWDEGVLGMKVGETRKLTIPPELGYGAQGAGGVIPPNATLIFEVTLQAIK